METGGRRENDSDFFDELKFWSAIKLRILDKYIDAYLRKRGRTQSRICYVDGFAGPGYYGRDGVRTSEGSPVRIARFAQQIKDEDRGYRLVCLNTEIDRQRCVDLVLALEQFDPDLTQTWCGAFHSRLPELLAVLGSSPAVCFLDPFGVVGVSVDDIRPILNRQDTEILLNLSTPTLHRLAGFEGSGAIEAQGKVAQVSRMLGDDPNNPEPLWLVKRRSLSSDDWEAWAANRFVELMKQQSPYLKFGAAHPIRERRGGGVKYYLVFASRSLEGFPFISDSICTEEDDLSLRAERPPGQLGMFEPIHETARAARAREVMEEIHAYGLDHQDCSRKAVFEEFSFRYLGEFQQKHYRAMLDKLEKDGRASYGVGASTKDRVPIRFR